jgi:hypothetical protein
MSTFSISTMPTIPASSVSTIFVFQNDTYHPLLPFIPAKPVQKLLPAKPCCAVCGPDKPCSVACRVPHEMNTAQDKQLSLCSRCRAVSYCGRDHQKADFANHKHVCRYVDKSRKKMDALAAKLPQALFTDRVDHFWHIGETRPFVYAKRDYMLALTATRSFEGVTLALAQGLDCLRLNRDDNAGIRDAVPALMLQLGQLQECYDFIKWWAAYDSRRLVDIKDPSVAMFSIKNAKMDEDIPLGFYDRRTSVFHWAALAFIKIQLALTAQVELDMQAEAAERQKTESGTLDVLMASLTMNTRPAMEKAYERLKIVAEDAMAKVGSLNKYFWPSVLDPHSLRGVANTSVPMRGGLFEVQSWLVPHGLLWSQHPVLKPFIKLCLAKSGSA